MKATGIEMRPLREMTGDALFNEVFLDDVFVPDECVVGEVNDGWKLARTTLANERVAMAGSQAGGEHGACRRALGRAVSRRPMLHGSATRWRWRRCASCSRCGPTLRSIAGRGPGAESSVAKMLGVRNRQEASELVVDLHGPAALFASDDPALAEDVHEMLLTRCLSIAGGTTQVLRNVVAERVLGLPRG